MEAMAARTSGQLRASVSAEMARVLFLVAVGGVVASGRDTVDREWQWQWLGVAREQAETLPKNNRPSCPPVLFLDAVGGSVWTLRIGSGSGSGSGVAILEVAREQAETLPKRTTPLVLFLDAVGGSVWTLPIIN